ncbi:MAG: hypothetical protein CMC08_05935, partial [Flavobacteriaceae bacterium]|nr:hypothetical protein [Flavobacteriaceae bacterium]
MTIQKIICSAIVLTTITACNNGPKVITAQGEVETEMPNSGIFSSDAETPSLTPEAGSGFSEDLHKVTVNEVLPTPKYV